MSHGKPPPKAPPTSDGKAKLLVSSREPMSFFSHSSYECGKVSHPALPPSRRRNRVNHPVEEKELV